jgi:hypothetical protein
MVQDLRKDAIIKAPILDMRNTDEYKKGFCDGLNDAGNLLVGLANQMNTAEQQPLKKLYQTLAETIHRKSVGLKLQFEKQKEQANGGLIT